MLLALSVISVQGAGMGPTAYKIFDERGGSIGRLDTNDWALPDPAKIVSSRHAEVHFSTGGGFYVQDMSTNGTFVNSREQAIERNAAFWLTDGDRIFIGEYEILVQIIDDGIPALNTGDARRQPRGRGGTYLASQDPTPPVRSPQDTTDPMALLRPALDASPNSGTGNGESAVVPVDWQITRFRNALPASVGAKRAAPAASRPLTQDPVGLLLALGLDPARLELNAHELAMLAGIRAGYQAVLERFREESAPHSEGGFRRLFGEAFESAYHRKLAELAPVARKP